MHVRWLRSLTRITYLCKLIGIHSLAAFLKLELFRVCASTTTVPTIKPTSSDNLLSTYSMLSLSSYARTFILPHCYFVTKSKLTEIILRHRVLFYPDLLSAHAQYE
ncbi:hypothetical protein D5078_06950 [Pectobacterium carotovorum]|nr:hypothetical protein D5078_06950 [Pectobacterium carotovorum]